MSTPPAPPPASPNPLGDAAATEDQVPLAAAAMVAGAAAAVTWAALVIWIALLSLPPGGGPGSLAQFDPDATYANIILFGLIPTPFVAAFTCWLLMLRIEANWRRGALVMVSVMAGVVVAMITTFVARQAFGRHGLLGLALLMLALTLWSARRARRAVSRLEAARS